ncbi:MAG: hypothetical protein JNK72_04570 [Myxococcales bacterium]|nr:hypothetical protein [Myxococcales bacterium]
MNVPTPTLRSLGLAALLLGCVAPAPRTRAPLYAVADGPLPNSTLQTSIPLVPGEETMGALGCGQTAWFRIATPTVRPYIVSILGQAQENSLGATATLTVTDANGAAFGSLLIPVFARAPNWDPRQQPFVPPAPGSYYTRVTLDPNGCQRVAFRLSIR